MQELCGNEIDAVVGGGVYNEAGGGLVVTYPDGSVYWGSGSGGCVTQGLLLADGRSAEVTVCYK